jgi:mono/diheme cytochrome c family protein
MSFARRDRVALVCASVAVLESVALMSSASTALAADAAHGEMLAKRWCAACHLVAPDQTRGVDAVPPFPTIARWPDFSADRIARFLLSPHPKMPDMQLGRGEAADLGAYIATLR